MTVVLAGGGTAGHIEPALATADALRRLAPGIEVVLVGTPKGLEGRLVPARGYELDLVPAVPLPRRPTAELLTLPGRLRQARRAAEQILNAREAKVVVGFGGYASLPVYLAARRRRVPTLVHEANVRPGLANRIGARHALHVYSASAACPLRGAMPIGIPLRPSIAHLDRAALRGQARAAFALGDGPVLLVTGGSQGARAVNRAVLEAASDLVAAGIQVLHIAGPANEADVAAAVPAEAAAGYTVVGYCDRMDLAYAAADLVIARSGAMTCAETAAVGLPAVFVPLPIGNGEQRLNAGPAVAAGAALMVDNDQLSAQYIRTEVAPLLGDPQRLTRMSEAARALGHRDADMVLARAIVEVAGSGD